MNLFATQKQFVRDFQKEINEAMQDAIRQFGFVIKDFVVNKQLFQKGIDGKGQRLTGYTRTTIRIKLSKGQPADRTTLSDEEEFHGSIQVDAYPDRFEVSSSVTHAKYLVKRYGQAIIMPSKENMEQFINVYFIPKLKENVNNKITG